MGNLSSREMERDRAVAGLFSHHGGGQQSRESGTQAAIGRAQRLTTALKLHVTDFGRWRRNSEAWLSRGGDWLRRANRRRRSMHNVCFATQECPDTLFMNRFHHLVERCLISRK